MLVTFVDRTNALIATQQGAYFEGRTLHLSWYVDPAAQNAETKEDASSMLPDDAEDEDGNDDMRGRYKRE